MYGPAVEPGRPPVLEGATLLHAAMQAYSFEQQAWQDAAAKCACPRSDTQRLLQMCYERHRSTPLHVASASMSYSSMVHLIAGA